MDSSPLVQPSLEEICYRLGRWTIGYFDPSEASDSTVELWEDFWIPQHSQSLQTGSQTLKLKTRGGNEEDFHQSLGSFFGEEGEEF
jgi:hypothetical protein